ncbi:hypothetical protein CBL_01151 [Carabus blaptoides fortunei]
MQTKNINIEQAPFNNCPQKLLLTSQQKNQIAATERNAPPLPPRAAIIFTPLPDLPIEQSTGDGRNEPRKTDVNRGKWRNARCLLISPGRDRAESCDLVAGNLFPVDTWGRQRRRAEDVSISVLFVDSACVTTTTITKQCLSGGVNRHFNTTSAFYLQISRSDHLRKLDQTSFQHTENATAIIDWRDTVLRVDVEIPVFSTLKDFKKCFLHATNVDAWVSANNSDGK